MHSELHALRPVFFLRHTKTRNGVVLQWLEIRAMDNVQKPEGLIVLTYLSVFTLNEMDLCSLIFVLGFTGLIRKRQLHLCVCLCGHRAEHECAFLVLMFPRILRAGRGGTKWTQLLYLLVWILILWECTLFLPVTLAICLVADVMMSFKFRARCFRRCPTVGVLPFVREASWFYEAVNRCWLEYIIHKS
jgi:hypothetical protein